MLRLISRLPLPLLYACADALGWLACHVLRVRRGVVAAQIEGAFPERAPAERRRIVRASYRNLADLLVEILKAQTIRPEELAERVRLIGLERLSDHLEAGRCVLIVSAHQCNWEWAYLACCLALQQPIHSIYKPIRNARVDRFMLGIRTRFGGRLIPAKQLVPDILEHKGMVRALAMVADQMPSSSRTRIWLEFLGLDTAFYPGPEDIARTLKYPVLFLGMRRTARGRYEASFEPLASPEEPLPAEQITRRYARAVEAQILAAPADWFWTHRRWKLKRSLYA